VIEMALCTQCGMILHEEDAPAHVCEGADLPAKGTMKKPTVTNKTAK